MAPQSAEGRPHDHARKTSQLDFRSKAPANHLDAAVLICRICRGEGSDSEPLFYPCKCSGSIKFVHQDCLMEWLSHSQKKYCELCKTSFRFTKLYDPDMPKTLPVHVFIQHMARYILRNFLVWLRALVAVLVWACWLPYFMRSVWSFVFWVSDEGLGSGAILTRPNASNTGVIWPPAPDSRTNTCPSSPLTPIATSSAAQGDMIEGVRGEGIAGYLVRIFLGSLDLSVKLGHPHASGDTVSPASLHNASLNSSLFGNVRIFEHLTRSPSLNRAIIRVLEGQVITVLVIVCFILIILVRDYVVQQQPEINMRAAFEEPIHEILDAPADGAQAPALEEAVPELPAVESDAETLDETAQEASARAANFAAAANIDFGVANPEHTVLLPLPQNFLPISAIVHEWQSAETDNPAYDKSSFDEFARVHRLAGGNFPRIQQIVEEEGLEDRLSHWIVLAQRSIRQQGAENYELSSSPSAADRQISSANGTNSGSKTNLALSEEVGSSDARVPIEAERPCTPLPPDAATSPWIEPTRPRAASDGPHHRASTNPLGSNNWSFTAIAADEFVNESPSAAPATSSAEVPSPENDSTTSRSAAIEDPARASSQTIAVRNASNLTEANSTEPNLVDANPTEALDGPEAVLGAESAGLVDRMADFMWGDLEDHDDDLEGDGEGDEAADDEDPWVDIPMVEEVDEDADANFEEADGAEALDPEAMDDMEDFEGVMELVGMRGPIAGLFQNAIFCAVLVSVTIFACVFAPYNIGRVTLWAVANPLRIARELLDFFKMLQDAAVMIGALSSWFALNLLDLVTSFTGGFVAAGVISARKASWGVWTGAGNRVMEYALMEFPVSASDMQNFSAISHEALLHVKTWITTAITSLTALATAARFHIFTADRSFAASLTAAATSGGSSVRAAVPLILNPGSWVIELGEKNMRSPVDPSLAHWPGLDRLWAILAGYLTMFAIAALYLKRGFPFARGHMMQAWEAGVIDTLHQASGIMKVILIISIEMLVFPLYCGLLLDGALLPLFEDATVKSRVLFTYNFPLTSIFVHWFVGTGYMFHFALFVSMCRKIMRPGVLYFIRDPDDPEFHPIRDVLERSLTTQLRKILFSALVYGVLVIVCLGGVVWGLAYGVPGALPIHYSSNEPVLEFPVDLLFYNFLMPQAVKILRPGDGLRTMYTWWFRKCARGLRLTYFLFGERRIDEEGTLRLCSTSPHYNSTSKTLFLGLDDHNDVVPRSWRDVLLNGETEPQHTVSRSEEKALRRKKQHLLATGQMIKSGRFVRAPASDRVKIQKGQRVFLPVTELGRRKDGLADSDLYASGQYQLVYVPPHFRARIFSFIILIWLFAAVTGVGITVVLLATGRKIFQTLIPDYVRTNDVYAFSIGIYVFGSVGYAIFCIHGIIAQAHAWANRIWTELSQGAAMRHARAGLVRASQIIYAYSVILGLFPLLFSAMMELYIAIPLHTYLDPPKSSEPTDHNSRHTIKIVQAWTLGLLYLNLGTRLVRSMFPQSRAALAMRTVVRRGWLQPDVGVLTRAFLVPGMALAVLVILGPPMAASLFIKLDILGSSIGKLGKAAVYRNSYPVAAVLALVSKYAIGLTRTFKSWKAGVRDEAYLIGERLHNLAGGNRTVKRALGSGRARV